MGDGLSASRRRRRYSKRIQRYERREIIGAYSFPLGRLKLVTLMASQVTSLQIQSSPATGFLHSQTGSLTENELGRGQ